MVRDSDFLQSAANMDFESIEISTRKVIVAVDFGTPYSGLAWAETRRADLREAIVTWPINNSNREGQSSEKAPTKLWYDPKTKDAQWGFAIPRSAPQEEVIQWFKLYVDSIAMIPSPPSAWLLKAPVTLTRHFKAPRTLCPEVAHGVPGVWISWL